MPLSALECKRLKALCMVEDQMREEGFSRIAGIDEAGRGPLAGPVVAAACILSQGVLLEGVNDSKKLTAVKRERLYHEITTHPQILYGIGVVDAQVIDQINILQATFRAMLLAVQNLKEKPDFILVDGNQLPPFEIPAKGIVGGDAKSQCIAAASVLAKVTRDRIMCEEFHPLYPDWQFDQHKGYATPGHHKTIAIYGLSPIHRLTFTGDSHDRQLTD